MITKSGKCPLCDYWIVVNFSMEDVNLGGKNMTCFKCKQFLWVPAEGVIMYAIKRTLGKEFNSIGDIESIRDVKCPVCDHEFGIKFNNKEMNDGGKSVFCQRVKCRIRLWVPVLGDLEDEWQKNNKD